MSTTRSPAAVFDRRRQPKHAGESRRAPGTSANLLGSALGVGVSVLRDRHAAWQGLDFGSRTGAPGGLRLRLDRRPACDGGIQFDRGTVESCCRSTEVVAATCRECCTRPLEAEYDGDSASLAG